MIRLIPSNSLERALDAVLKRTGPPHRFYRELMDSVLFLANELPESIDSNGSLIPGKEFGTVTYRYQRAEWIPAFTSLRMFKHVFGDNNQFVKLKTKSLFEMICDDSVLLNPQSDSLVTLDPPLIEALRDGSIYEPSCRAAFDWSPQVIVQDPEHDLSNLQHDLRTLFLSYRAVRDAFLVEVVHEEATNQSELVLGVTASTDWPEIQKAIHVALRHSLPEGKVANLIELTDRCPFGKHLHEHHDPFYTRASGFGQLG